MSVRCSSRSNSVMRRYLFAVIVLSMPALLCAMAQTANAANAAADGPAYGYESRGGSAYKVQLDGTSSQGARSFDWEQLAQGGQPVALRGADTATPDFDAPQWDGTTELTPCDATLRFRLTINMGAPDADSSECEVYIRIPGDSNGDNVVNAFDVARLRQFQPDSDFNGDGRTSPS